MSKLLRAVVKKDNLPDQYCKNMFVNIIQERLVFDFNCWLSRDYGDKALVKELPVVKSSRDEDSLPGNIVVFIKNIATVSDIK